MTELPTRIRDYRPEDLDTLYDIDSICFPEDIAFSKEEFRLYLNLPTHLGLVAEKSGTILGFVLAHTEYDSWAHIVTLDVLPEYRRRHVGALLMRSLQDAIERRGVRTIILEVACGNHAAQKLYSKLHYKIIGTLSGYYHGREDAYRMVRTSD